MSTNAHNLIISYLTKSGPARAREITALGVQREHISRLVADGTLVRTTRGVYRLAELPVSSSGQFADVSRRIPRGVIALLSALRFHEIGTQNPSEVWIAVERGSASPSIDYPPVRVTRISGKAFREGIEQHKIDGVKVAVYSIAKTIADCFKYRNKIGIDVAVEALRDALQKRRLKLDDLWKYSAVCRVTRIVRPYVEALI